MEPATLVVYGRYWYDFLTVAWLVGFFMIEMLLLFRNSVLGWAMTAKCLALGGIYFWVMVNPPPVLAPEDITIGTALLRAALIVILGLVIVILVTMRLRRQTIVVGTFSESEPPRDMMRE